MGNTALPPPHLPTHTGPDEGFLGAKCIFFFSASVSSQLVSQPFIISCSNWCLLSCVSHITMPAVLVRITEFMFLFTVKSWCSFDTDCPVPHRNAALFCFLSSVGKKKYIVSPSFFSGWFSVELQWQKAKVASKNGSLLFAAYEQNRTRFRTEILFSFVLLLAAPPVQQ